MDTEPVPSDVDRDLMLFDVSRRALSGYYWDFPTIVDGRELVCRGVYLLRNSRAEPSIEIQHMLAAELAARGLDLARYKKKRYAERGFELHAPLSRPRVLLIGEAAGIDPVTGEGIAQAIQYGAVAGSYVARKLRTRDLFFDDWRHEVMGSMIGHDLSVRTLGVGPSTARTARRSSASCSTRRISCGSASSISPANAGRDRRSPELPGAWRGTSRAGSRVGLPTFRLYRNSRRDRSR